MPKTKHTPVARERGAPMNVTAHTPFGNTTTARRDWACFLQACSEGHDPDGMRRFHEMWAAADVNRSTGDRKDLQQAVERAVLEVYL